MITVVGSFNMDLFIETPHFPAPGVTVFGKNFRRAPGGKGANQAYTIARMGMPTAMIGAVGQDAFGEEMVANLQSIGVDVTGVMRRDNVPSGVGIVTLDASGQNQIVVANGANDTVTTEDISAHAALIRKSRAVVAQLEIPLPAVETTLRLARESGALTVLNPAPFVPVSDDLLALCDWIIPNEHEATRLTNLDVRNAADAKTGAQILKQKSGCKNILITLGTKGVWLDTPETSCHLPAFKVQAVDTVGAGDTFIGAFVTRLLEGAPHVEAARFGCAAAAISVTRRGAQASVPTRAEVEELLAG